MAIWISSIAGIVVLTVLLDVILPEGQINKYVKSVLALLTVVAVASPLPALFTSLIPSDASTSEGSSSTHAYSTYESFLTDFLSSDNTSVAASDDNFVSSVNEARLVAFANGAEEFLSAHGHVVEVEAHSDDFLLLGAQKIEIICDFSEKSLEEQHIFMTEVTDLLAERYSLSEERIVFAETTYG